MRGLPSVAEVVCQRGQDPPGGPPTGAAGRMYQHQCGVPEPAVELAPHEQGYDVTTYDHWTDEVPMYKFTRLMLRVKGRAIDYHKMSEDDWYERD